MSLFTAKTITRSRCATQRIRSLITFGQAAGELYDLTADPHELDNLWNEPAHAAQKATLINQLLAWLATSTYYNAGYKQ
ncbi:MAG: hypothetical protein R2932_01675 [Caldilineaceae bacterium]